MTCWFEMCKSSFRFIVSSRYVSRRRLFTILLLLLSSFYFSFRKKSHSIRVWTLFQRFISSFSLARLMRLYVVFVVGLCIRSHCVTVCLCIFTIYRSPVWHKHTLDDRLPCGVCICDTFFLLFLFPWLC